MSLRKALGVVFILVALISVGLLISRYQTVLSKTNPIWEAKSFQIVGPGNSWLNATLNPSHKQAYRAVCSIVPVLSDDIPPDFDLWVVNQTGLDLLIEERRTGVAPLGFPPRAYALVSGIRNGSVRSFELRHMDYDGEYYFYFENYLLPQNLLVTLTESWTETSALVEFNLLNLAIIFSLMILGIYLFIGHPSARRKRIHTAKQPNRARIACISL